MRIHTQEEFSREIDVLERELGKIDSMPEKRQKLAEQITSIRITIEHTSMTRWHRKVDVYKRYAKLKDLKRLIRSTKEESRRFLMVQAVCFSVFLTCFTTASFLSPVWKKLSVAILPVPQSSVWTPWIILLSLILLQSFILITPTLAIFYKGKGYHFILSLKDKLVRYHPDYILYSILSTTRLIQGMYRKGMILLDSAAPILTQDGQLDLMHNQLYANCLLGLCLFLLIYVIRYVLFAIYIVIAITVCIAEALSITGFAFLAFFVFPCFYPIVIPFLLEVMRETATSNLHEYIAYGLSIVALLISILSVLLLFKDTFITASSLRKNTKRFINHKL